jgi:hypothetical protein
MQAKLVFIQVEEIYKAGLLEILSNHTEFNDAGYYFILLPMDANIMSKESIEKLLGRAFESPQNKVEYKQNCSDESDSEAGTELDD